VRFGHVEVTPKGIAYFIQTRHFHKSFEIHPCTCAKGSAIRTALRADSSPHAVLRLPQDTALATDAKEGTGGGEESVSTLLRSE